MVSALDRLTYAARQTARVAWYAGHYAAGRRLLRPMPKPEFPIGPTPSRAEMTADMRALFEREWQDIAAGLFPAPRPRGPEPAEFLRRSLLYFRDLPQVDARRHGTLDEELPPGQQGDGLPHYYRQNFHFQSEGYLGHTSAALYDLQVELLFGGSADAMRRRVIPPVVQFARERNSSPAEPLRLLDVACGTGRLLSMLGAALPAEAKLFGVDLSPHYIARAREVLPRDLDVSLVCDNAEKLPFLDGSFDAATSVYLLHEVPAEVRARVLREIHRVVRPGGLVVIADSIQLRDAPELSREILAFPSRFHEPYYMGYVKDDLAARVGEAGFEVKSSRLAFLTKLVTAEKRAPAPA